MHVFHFGMDPMISFFVFSVKKFTPYIEIDGLSIICPNTSF